MSIWKKPASTDDLNQRVTESMAGHLGMRFTEVGEDFVRATMPLSERTRQHKGILHGGANVVFAETLANMASVLCCEPGTTSVGLEINANHLRAVRTEGISGIARPVHLGRSTHVWDIRIFDAAGKPSCIARLTTSVIPEPQG